MDGLSKLIDALAHLISAVAWPGFAAFAVWWLASSLRNVLEALAVFLGRIKEGSFEAWGIKLSARQREAQAAVVVAQLHKGGDARTGVTGAPSQDRVAASLAKADALVTRRTMSVLAGQRVLWVDDNPDKNIWERNALEALGVKVVPVTSTESALEAMKGLGGGYDLIISDMTRGTNKMAGYDLLTELRSSGRKTPFIIYAGSANAEQQQAALDRGATGRANDPESLIRLVVDALSPTV